MKTTIKEVKIFLHTPNAQMLIFDNGDWENPTNEEIIEAFDLAPFHYGTILDNVQGPFNSFNTYNHNAPLTICGSFNEGLDFAIFNLHNGGDARGNYSAPYYSDNYDSIESILSQQTYLYIETTEGHFTIDCDNGEAYFNFDTFDLFDLKEGDELTEDQLNELESYKQ